MNKKVLDSLKRQYEKGNLEEAQIKQLLDTGEISAAEYDYIVKRN